jgi:hypothetical protein
MENDEGKVFDHVEVFLNLHIFQENDMRNEKYQKRRRQVVG